MKNGQSASIIQDRVAEEWPHMHRQLGTEGAIRRLADAYKVTSTDIRDMRRNLEYNAARRARRARMANA